MLKIIAFCYIVLCVGFTICFILDISILDCLVSPAVLNQKISFVGLCIAIANALLLYATLMFQGKSFRQERFETTLFNLLDNHRKLINEIRFSVEKWNWNFSKYNEYIEGNDVFAYAITEVSLLNKLICDNNFPTMDDMTFQECIADIENQKDYISQSDNVTDYNTDGNLIVEKYELWRRAVIYDIKEDMWNVCKMNKGVNNENSSKMAYALFYKKMNPYYDVYFNSLSLVLEHISNSRYFSRTEKSNYKDYVTKQLSNNEIKLIKLHCKYDRKFSEIIKGISIRSKWYKPIIEKIRAYFDFL